MILVSGGAGFIGSHLCDRLLDAGHDVLCLDNFNDFYDPRLKEQNIAQAREDPKFSLVRGDILDLDLLQRTLSRFRPEKVVHLAAAAGVRPSIASPAKYADVDVKGVVNVLEISRQYGVRQFVFGSSSSVYGADGRIPFSEDHPTNVQISPYAVAKKAGELYCATYHHLYEIPTTVLRFFTVYGPRQRPDMAIRSFTELMMEEKPIPLFGDGNSQRDYTYIDDCIEGIRAAIDKPFDFEIFNIGSSRPIRLKDLIESIARKLGVSPRIERLPEAMGDAPITCADVSKARSLLGYHPMVSLEEGIESFISWYRKWRSTA